MCGVHRYVTAVKFRQQPACNYRLQNHFQYSTFFVGFADIDTQVLLLNDAIAVTTIVSCNMASAEM